MPVWVSARVLADAPLVLEGASSGSKLRVEAVGSREGVLVWSPCIEMSFLKLIDVGVPALEEESLVGEIDLARSVIVC